MSSTTKLNILLVRPPYATGLTFAAHLVTEPLDLEYLAAVAAKLGHTWHIHDSMVPNKPFSSVLADFKPDVVAITGFYPAKDAMLATARTVKTWCQDTKVIIGGVHAELNPSDFFHTDIDAIVYSGGAHTFSRWLLSLSGGTCTGTWQNNPTITATEWIRNPPPDPTDINPSLLPLPDRSHFYKYRHLFTYLHYGSIALVQSARGCPHSCSFCSCRLLNDGQFTPRPIEEVADEIASLDCEKIWLVDDTFLAISSRAASLAAALERRNIHKRFIIYARASDITRTSGIVNDLCRLGVMDVIVGLEAVHDKCLADYKKNTTANDNRQCVETLHAAGIACTGLFIIPPDATIVTFRNMNRWIASVPLSAVAVSIFTPFPGTPDWERYESKLTTRDCRKWDLCHLVLPPENLPRWFFYVLFGWSHLRPLLHNSALRRSILRQLFIRIL